MSQLEISSDGCRVRVRLFARYAELIGASVVELVVPPNSTVSNVLGELKRKFAVAASFPTSPLVAVNLQHAGLEHVVTSGDEVALLPPLAGG